MSKLKVFATVLVGLLGLFVAVSFLLPAHWEVERSIVIRAPANRIFPYMNDLKKWPVWTHWDDIDPNMQREFTGPEEGVGAHQTWTGQRIGNGTLTLTASDPNQGIGYNFTLQHGHYVAHGKISLTPISNGTKVAWLANGDLGNNPASRYFGLMFDSYMGGDFEQSLATLKELAEKPAGENLAGTTAGTPAAP